MSTEIFPHDLTLMVSLPANDVDLARAARDGGASALKVHTNVGHRASGTAFGDVEQERHRIEQIIALGLPTGVVPGEPGRIHRDQVEHVVRLGVAFCDVYLRGAPAWFADGCLPAAAMVATGPDDDPAATSVLADLGIAAVEASNAEPEAYGTELPFEQLVTYRQIVEASGLPVVVPTQHAITPADVPALLRTGVRGLLLGAVVTGTEAASIREATERFAEAIARAGAQR